MNRRDFCAHFFASGSLSLLPSQMVLSAVNPVYYGKDDVLDKDIYVYDKEQTKIFLNTLLADRLNILYLFGGGALGIKNKRGGLWCGDSFEDLHILRGLHKKYKSAGVGFVAVAFPPIFDSHKLGHPRGVFLNESDGSADYQKAVTAFIESTQGAYNNGLIPVQPHYDLRYRLLMSKRHHHSPNYGRVESWQGNLRRPDETQSYGVPHLWLLNGDGAVMSDPFRGNIYHGIPGTFAIQYNLEDVDATIQSLLDR